MMAMVCSTNWVLVSLIGTWKQNKYLVKKDQSSERKITICILTENNNWIFKDSYFIRMTSTVLLTGPCVSKNLPMLFLSLLKSMG